MADHFADRHGEDDAESRSRVTRVSNTAALLGIAIAGAVLLALLIGAGLLVTLAAHAAARWTGLPPAHVMLASFGLGAIATAIVLGLKVSSELRSAHVCRSERYEVLTELLERLLEERELRERSRSRRPRVGAVR